MEKFIVKKNIGEFISKMYEANEGRKMEMTIEMDSSRIQIYYKDAMNFEHVTIVDEEITIGSLVESLSK